MTEAELAKNADFIKLKETYPQVTFVVVPSPVGLKINNNSFVMLLLQVAREGGLATMRVPIVGKQLPLVHLERTCELLTGMANRSAPS